MLTAEKYFDNHAKDYDAEFSDTSVWSIAHRVATRLVQEKMPHAPRCVADIGCGTGKWGLVFARGGASVLFSDISKEMVERALESAAARGVGRQATSHVGSVDDLKGLGTSECDLTLCMGDPLSYCGNPRKGISELVRITRPGGHILTSVDSRLGYMRVFKERDGYNLDALAAYLKSGNVVGWEGLPLHAFRPDELRSAFAEEGAECVGLWGLPIVSSYFLFDPAFRERLRDEAFMSKLIELEVEAAQWGSAPGTHHLYGLFKRVR